MNKLEKQVLEYIGENTSSPDVFKDDDIGLAPIRDSINEAIQEIIMLYGGYKETFSIPLIEDKRFYRLTFENGSMGWVTNAWLVIQKRRLDQTSLIGLEQYDPKWISREGTPEVYMPIGLNAIGVHPRPTASSDILELECVVIPDNYRTDKERIKLRDTFQWSVINYAVSEYWASRGDATTALTNYQSYLDNSGVRKLFMLSPENITQLRTSKLATRQIEQKQIQ